MASKTPCCHQFTALQATGAAGANPTALYPPDVGRIVSSPVCPNARAPACVRVRVRVPCRACMCACAARACACAACYVQPVPWTLPANLAKCCPNWNRCIPRKPAHHPSCRRLANGLGPQALAAAWERNEMCRHPRCLAPHDRPESIPLGVPFHRSRQGHA